ncbi:MAG TPA: 50S ribosomal protein L13 [Candidatus Acidoferrum sp.]|nr:50S ribosomal protein L13 [Candidatus Acidoferrum sp.]
MLAKKTFTLKTAEISREWIVFDAAQAPLGRIATAAAQQLIGKHKPTYTAHVDNGNYVIVINAARLVVTGNNKATDKMYYHYSGYPGGLKAKSLQDVVASDPGKAIVAAVRGMLPKNKLQSERLKRLKVYAGETHNHEAQKPTLVQLNRSHK